MVMDAQLAAESSVVLNAHGLTASVGVVNHLFNQGNLSQHRHGDGH